MNVSKAFKFLAALKENNSKEWFESHKSDYLEIKNELEHLIDAIIAELSMVEPELQGLDAKKCVYRIYRDVRFSTDKTPYKINIGASITIGGKKSNKAGYYIHIQPGNESFVAGGVYMPENDVLTKVRQEIDYNLDEFKQIVEATSFKKRFGGLWNEHKLKTVPKGYPKDHPALEYLQHKSYIAWQSFSDEEYKASSDLKKMIVESINHIRPLVQFINRAIEG